MKVTIEVESDEMVDLVRAVERAARQLATAKPEQAFERELRSAREAIGFLRYEPETYEDKRRAHWRATSAEELEAARVELRAKKISAWTADEWTDVKIIDDLTRERAREQKGA